MSRPLFGGQVSSIIILLAVLKVANRAEYSQIGTESSDLTQIGRFFRELFQPESRIANWWFGVYLASSFEPEEIPILEIEKALKENGYVAKDTLVNVHTHLNDYSQLFGGAYPSKWLKRAYERIEAILQYD